VGLFSRAKRKLGSGEEEDDGRTERWGRIVAIDSKAGPAVTLHLEVHLAEQPLETVKISTNAPFRHSPRVGDDVAILPTIGAYATEVSYRIAWGEPPQYGIPAATEERRRDFDPAQDALELDLQRRGVSARATVVDLPEPIADDPGRLRMPLDVEAEGGGIAYRVSCAFPAARPVGELAVGNWLPIKIDPDDRERVAVAWNLWLADRGRPPRRG
jgi:hypothetical protein